MAAELLSQAPPLPAHRTPAGTPENVLFLQPNCSLPKFIIDFSLKLLCGIRNEP